MHNELTPSWFLGIDWTGAATQRGARAERYQLLAPLGIGGHGEVWRALDPESGAELAIKVLSHEVARQARFQAGLRREVRAVSRLRHRNVVRVHDVGTLGPEAERATAGRLVAGSPFIAMELVPGGTLQAWSGEAKPWPVVRDVARQLLWALRHSHARGVVHLDLKPSNILRRAPPGAEVVLSDFGIAWITADGPGQVAPGTIAYAAPEQLTGDSRAIGPWSDLFSVGCVVWELLTGEPPFAQRAVMERVFASPGPFRPRTPVPEHVAGWLAHLLEPSVRRRCASAPDAIAGLSPPGVVALDGDAAERPARGLAADWRTDEPALPGEEPFGAGLWGLGVVPLVGRERERDALWQAARALVDGRGARVCLSGPSGSGRLRLAEWLRARLREAGAAQAFGLEIGRGERLADAVARHLRVEGLSVRRAAERLAPRVGQWLADAAAEALVGEHRDPTPVLALLEALAAERPLAVFTDQETPLPALRGPVLVVRLCGPGAAGEGEREIPLLPLAPGERHALCRGVLGLGPRVFATLERSGEHTPGALIHRVAAWAEQQALTRTEAGVELLPGWKIEPAEHVGRARIDGLASRLGEPETRALEVAAVLGSGAEAELWRAAAEACDTTPSWAALDRLAADGLGGAARPAHRLQRRGDRRGAVRSGRPSPALDSPRVRRARRRGPGGAEARRATGPPPDRGRSGRAGPRAAPGSGRAEAAAPRPERRRRAV